MGLVEEEWITTLSVIDSDDIDYEDFILAGKRIANKFKNEYVSKITCEICIKKLT